MKKKVSIVLCLVLTLGAATSPVFATSPDTSYFQTSSGYYWYQPSGTTSTITSGTKLANLVGQLGGNLSQHLYNIYARLQNLINYVDGLEGYVDDLEGYQSALKSGWGGVSIASPSAPSGYSGSWYYNVLYRLEISKQRLQSIIDGVSSLSGFVDGLEGYVDGVEGSLSSILSAVEGISITDYSSVLSTISSRINTTNTRLNTTNSSLGTIDSSISVIKEVLGTSQEGSTGIWAQTTSMSRNLGLLQPDVSSILVSSNSILSKLSVSGNIQNPIFVSGYGDNNVNGAPGGNINFSEYSGFGQMWNINSNYGSYQFNSNNRSLNLADYIVGLNNNMLQIGGFVKTPKTVYNIYTNDFSDGVANLNNTARSYSVMDYLFFLNREITQFSSRVGYMFADDSALAAKQANANQENAALTGFTGSGSAAASVSDINAVKDSVGALKGATSGGASFSQAFNIFGGNSDGWSWFTQATADSLDTTSNGSRMLRASVSDSHPYLDAYYSDIYSILGGGGLND